MAVPKKRVGHSAQGHRRSNWKATVPETTTCKNCGELTLTHTVCTKCGYYKGKVVSIKAEGYVESELTKKTKKTKTTAKPKKIKKEEVVENITEETTTHKDIVKEEIVESVAEPVEEENTKIEESEAAAKEPETITENEDSDK